MHNNSHDSGFGLTYDPLDRTSLDLADNNKSMQSIKEYDTEKTLLEEQETPFEDQELSSICSNKYSSTLESSNTSFSNILKPNILELRNEQLTQIDETSELSRSELRELKDIIQEKINSFKDLLKNKSKEKEKLQNGVREEKEKLQKMLQMQDNNPNEERYQLTEYYEKKVDSLEKCKENSNIEFKEIKEEMDQSVKEFKRIDDAKRASQLAESTFRHYERKYDIALSRIRDCLPIYSFRKSFIEEIKKNKIVFVVGEPGCGKSTQIPQYLLETSSFKNKDYKILMSLPRKVAAIGLQNRINDEQLVESSQGMAQFYSEVDSIKGTGSKIILMTNDTLYKLFMLTSYKELIESVGAIIIDEINLRLPFADILISTFKKLVQHYPHLRLILLGNAMKLDEYKSYFENLEGNIGAIKVSQSNYPINMIYYKHGSSDKKSLSIMKVLREIEQTLLKRTLDYDKCKTHQNERLKDARHILIFLSCASEVTKVHREVSWVESEKRGVAKLIDGLRYKTYVAHGGAIFEDENNIFENIEDNKTIKLILATKVLETSITIEQVGFVVDFGEEERHSYAMKIQANISRVSQVSRVTANQRAGRTGRTCTGVCYRMYSEEDYQDMDIGQENATTKEDGNAELITLNLLSMIMQNKESWLFDQKYEVHSEDKEEQTIRKIHSLDVMFIRDFLNNDILKTSLQNLRRLRLLGEDYLLTKNGLKVQKLSIESPRISKIIIKAQQMKILREILKVLVICRKRGVFRADRHHSNQYIARSSMAMEYINYGDFIINYVIFEEYISTEKDARREFCKKHDYHEGTLRNAERLLFAYQRECQDKLGLRRKYFQEQTSRNETKEQLYNSINKCLLYGFAANVSQYIGKGIGLFIHMNGYCSNVHPSSLYGLIDDDSKIPELICSADVSKAQSLKSKWLFPFQMEWLHDISELFLKKIMYNKEHSRIPSEILTFSLCSSKKYILKSKQWLLERVLIVNGQTRGTVIDLYAPGFKFKIAVSPTFKKDIRERVEELIESICPEEYERLYFVRVEPIGSVVFGDGLAIKDIISNHEFSGFYLKYVPRKFFPGEQELAEYPKQILKLLSLDKESNPDCNYDWIKIEMSNNEDNKHEDFTYYHFKVTLRNSNDANSVYKLAKNQIKKIKETVFEEDFKNVIIIPSKSTLGMLSSERTTKVIFKFSERLNTGKCKLNFKKGEDLEKVMSYLKTLDPEQNCFVMPGKVLKISSSDGNKKGIKFDIFLDELRPQIDEKFIIKQIKRFLKSKKENLRYEMKVDLHKEDSNISSNSFETFDTWRNKFRESITKEFERELEDEPLDVYIHNKAYRRQKYKCMRKVELTVSSKSLANKIIERFNNTLDILTNHYVHGRVRKRLVFFIRKSTFMKLKPTIELMNLQILNKVKESYSSVSIDSNMHEIEKKVSYLRIPKQEIIDEKDDRDKILFEFKEGTYETLAKDLLRGLIPYIRGEEIYVKETAALHMFGKAGYKLAQSIKDESPTCFVYLQESKRVWVIHEIPRNMEKLRDRVLNEMRSVSSDAEQIYRYRLNADQISFILEENKDKRKDNFNKLKEYLESSTHIHIRKIEYRIDRFERNLIVRFSKSNLAELKKFIGNELNKRLEEWEKNKKRVPSKEKEEELDSWNMSDDQSDDDSQINDSRVSKYSSNFVTEDESKPPSCYACTQQDYIIKLENCGHIICEQCLHNIVSDKFEQLLEINLKNPEEKLLFCTHEACDKSLSINDCFISTSEASIHPILRSVINRLTESSPIYNSKLKVCKDPSCNELFRITSPVSNNSPIKCPSCETDA